MTIVQSVPGQSYFSPPESQLTVAAQVLCCWEFLDKVRLEWLKEEERDVECNGQVGEAV